MAMISSRMHGIIDYLVVIFLWISPSAFGLTGNAAIFTYVLGAVHLLLTIMTDFSLGMIRLIPFRIHGLIELIVSLALVMTAYYFGDIGDMLARNFYYGFAGAVFLTWLLTDYKKNRLRK
ncbi:MAG: hypothetical protein EOO88_24580 [Pedobacter sp.]|nr:MAG: hypothetical protein EOO88_24580 [Pedobacter sp.]